MAEPNSSLPGLAGILAAFGGLIVAVGGLLAVLHQVGWIGRPKAPADVIAEAQPVAQPGPPRANTNTFEAPEPEPTPICGFRAHVNAQIAAM